MKRLDEIPRKTLFEVPEGYFEKLPGVIQARVASPAPEVAWGTLALRYAFPVLILAAATTYFLSGSGSDSTEEVLASIDSEQLVAYLEESELNTDDLLEILPLELEEVQAIEEDALDEYILNEIEIEELASELDTLRN